MRKQQQALVEKGKKHGFPDGAIQLLSEERFSIRELNMFFHFMNRNDLVAEELYAELREFVDDCDRAHEPYMENSWKMFHADDWESWPFLYYRRDHLDRTKQMYIKDYIPFLYRKGYSTGVIRVLICSARGYLKKEYSRWHIARAYRADLELVDREGYPGQETVAGNSFCSMSSHFRSDQELGGILEQDFLRNGEDAIILHLVPAYGSFLFSEEIIEMLPYAWDANSMQWMFPVEEVLGILECRNVDKDQKGCTREVGFIGTGKDDLRRKMDGQMERKYPHTAIAKAYALKRQSECEDPAAQAPEWWSEGNLFQFSQISLADRGENLPSIQDLAMAESLVRRSITVPCGCEWLRLKWNLTGKLNIVDKYYQSIQVDTSGKVHPRGNGNEKAMFITPGGQVLQMVKGKRWVPLSIQSFMKLLDGDSGRRPQLAGLCQGLAEYIANTNPFILDIIRDYRECGRTVPGTIEDLKNYHTREEFLKAKYPLAVGLPIKWNRQNIYLSYMILKAYPRVAPGISQRILVQQKNAGLVTGISCRRWTDCVNEFIARTMLAHISVCGGKNGKGSARKKQLVEELGANFLPEEEREYVAGGKNDLTGPARDYVQMERQSKHKIRLDIRSEEHLINLHDNTARTADYRTNTRDVNIPENSKFNRLRELLPEEFEWIKTRKRLIMEADLQHHCVWSYAGKISGDRCAIYSYVDHNAAYAVDHTARRYTIEFCINREGKYYVEQVQGRYDTVNANGMKGYIQSILDEYQSKQVTA